MFLSVIDFVFSVHNDGCSPFICFFENNFFVVNVNKLLESSSLHRPQTPQPGFGSIKNYIITKIHPPFQNPGSAPAWVQLALVVCYVPFGVVAIIVNISGWSRISSLLWVFATSLVNLNSSLNPILYFWKMREVRQAVQETMRQFISFLG